MRQHGKSVAVVISNLIKYGISPKEAELYIDIATEIVKRSIDISSVTMYSPMHIASLLLNVITTMKYS